MGLNRKKEKKKKKEEKVPSEMVQQLKAPATKPDNINLSPGIPKFHLHSGRNEPIPCKLSSDIYTHAPVACTLLHTYTIK